MAATVQIVVKYADPSANARRATADGLKGIGDAAEKAKAPLNGFQQTAVGAFRRVGEMAVNALQNVGAALVSSVGAAVKGAGDYEQSMDVFAAQSEATAKQMDQVRATARALGGDLTLPATSAADAGTAMLELSKAGLAVDQAMGAAKGTLQLAAAAQIDEATAASITANALNTFKMSGDQAVAVADMLAAGANSSSASMTDMADSIKQGGFAFAAAGQSLNDLVAATAILTNVGLTGSDSGTALKNAMMRLMDPTDQAAKLMKQLGINVYDAQGKMLPLRDIIGVLNAATSGMTQQQRNAALSTIFLSDGMKAMLPLLDQGVSGFDKMKATVGQQGVAARMAGAQMQGLNGVVAGLTSQVETLALEGLEPLLPIMTSVIAGAAAWAGSFVGHVGPAVQGAIVSATALAGVIGPILMPAIGGTTAALAAYALVQTAQAIPAMILLLPQIAATIVAFEAQAVTVMAAVAPYAMIALAIGGVIAAYTNFQVKMQSATDQLLQSREWWSQSTAAIQSYGQATGDTATKLSPYATEISNIRARLQEEIQSLAQRDAAGLVSEQQRATEKEHINALAGALQSATGRYTEQEQALIRSAAAGMTATNAMGTSTVGMQTMSAQAALTTDDLEKLGKALEDIYAKGAQAVTDYVTTESAFLAKATELRGAASSEQLAQQALAYAQEQAAQRAHLGQMLADYTANQVGMGNITAEAGNKIVGEIQARFGIMEDTGAQTFMAMASQIDSFASSGSHDVRSLGSALDATASDAVAAKGHMDALAKQYTAELVHNFNQGKISAEELAAKLRAIPSRITSEVNVHTTYTESGRRHGGDQGDDPPGRAIGGPVTGGGLYMVGERGPELFVPQHSGTIVPNEAVQIGGTTVNNYILNYAGAGASAGTVGSALRMQQLLYG